MEFDAESLYKEIETETSECEHFSKYWEKCYDVIDLFPEIQKNIKYVRQRDYFAGMYSWAIPSREAIKEISQTFSNDNVVLEIAAGTGLWAKLLSNEGLNIIATDVKHHKKMYYNVEILSGIDAVTKYNTNILMICWAPYNMSVSADVIKIFRGNYIIHIGEYGGCTDNEEFFNILDSEWKQIKKIKIPQWYGVHDKITIWERKDHILNIVAIKELTSKSDSILCSNRQPQLLQSDILNIQVIIENTNNN